MEAIGDLDQDVPRYAGNFSNAQEAVRRLRAQGSRFWRGRTGTIPAPRTAQACTANCKMLVDAGLTPIEALASATSVNASAFQLNDHGQMAPGKRADLPVVDGDSTPGYRTSATSLRSGSWVFRSIVRITAPS